MPEINVKTKFYWYEKINEKWFLCFSKRHHGKTIVVRVSLDEIAVKIKEAN
jgi:hypothetical protein